MTTVSYQFPVGRAVVGPWTIVPPAMCSCGHMVYAHEFHPDGRRDCTHAGPDTAVCPCKTYTPGETP